MHGRPRAKKGTAEDPEKVRKQKQKAALTGQLVAAVLARRAERNYDEESMTLSAQLLQRNPEVYTVWNYRREALGPVLEDPSSEAARAAVAGELALTLRALHENPKSYAAWHHRGWAVERGAADLQQELALVQKLLSLDDRNIHGRAYWRLLSLDDRNFHGWAYWRWVVNKAGVPPEECLAFTDTKLRENFSNYSAWHARSALLAAAAAPAAVPTLAQLLAAERGGGGGGAAFPQSGSAMPAPARVPKEALEREFDLVHRALWTEPRDQSAWLYHRWLLGSCLAAAGVTSGSGSSDAAGATAGSGAPSAAGGSTNGAAASRAAAGSGDDGAALDALQGRLEAEAAMCQELLEEEPEAKWPLLTLARVREAQAALQQQQHGVNSGSVSDAEQRQDSSMAAGAIGSTTSGDAGGDSAAAGSAGGSGRAAPAALEAGAAYERLEALDPLRSGYYRDAAAGRARVVLHAANASSLSV